MDSAFLGGLAKFFLSLLLWKGIIPATSAKGRSSTGRRLTAWTVAFSSFLLFPSSYRLDDGRWWFVWICGVGVLGVISFVTGYCWALMNEQPTPLSKGSIDPGVVQAPGAKRSPLPASSEALAILDVRLAKGEVSLDEYHRIRGALSASHLSTHANRTAQKESGSNSDTVSLTAESSVARDAQTVESRKQPAHLQPAGKLLPKPEDFSDPKIAKAVKEMREALRN